MSMGKKHILLSIIATIMLVITISGVAYAFVSAHYVVYDHGYTWNSIKAGFYPCYPTDGTYGTRWNGHLRRCRVKIVGLLTTEGWNYSARAGSSSDCSHYWAYAWKIDDPGTDYSYYNWYEYF